MVKYMYKHLSRKTKNWVHKSIEDCMSCPKYSVGMFLNSEELRNEFSDGIVSLIGSSNIEYVTHSSIATCIKLANESIVHIFNVDGFPVWKGRRYVCIIYDKDIDKSYGKKLKNLRMAYGRDGEVLSESKLYEIKFR